MTALKQYDRLEATGLWRPAPQEQRREVVLTFGDATLVISDNAMRPLTHWSLAAINRSNPDERPAVFLPGPDAAETLEIDDQVMIEAIRDYYLDTGVSIAMKPAGGIRTAKQALTFLIAIKETLGDAWLNNARYRFGASALLNDLIRQIAKENTVFFWIGS